MSDWRVSIPFGQDKVTSTVRHERKLGTYGETPDGRLFRWAFSNGSIAAGRLVAPPVAVVEHDLDLAVETAGVVGDMVQRLTIGAAQIEEDDYEDGSLWIDDGPGEGVLYKIKSHPLILTGATGLFTMWEPLRIATTTAASQVGLHANQGKHVVINPATQTQPVYGVTPVTITDDTYFWAQVRGEAAVLVGTTGDNLEIGRLAVPDAAVVAGGVEGLSYATDSEFRSVGSVMGVVGGDTDFILLDLHIR